MKRDAITSTHIQISNANANTGAKEEHKLPSVDIRQTVFEPEVWDGKETTFETPLSATLPLGGTSAVSVNETSSLNDTIVAPELLRKQARLPSELLSGSLEQLTDSQSDSEGLRVRRTTVLPKAMLKGEAATLHKDFRDRYEKLKALGEGAVGDVALARDNDINRLVALKHLKKEHHAPGAVARFVEEIQTIGALEHPNIVPIHDVGVDEDEQYYFVMKYVQGQTMADIIERLQAGDPETHERYPFEVRNQVFLKILEAVQFAHDKGIVHRDLKPANIMIGPHGEVMVMDWGLAKQIGLGKATASHANVVPASLDQSSHAVADTQEARRAFETQIGSLIGTPAYMAPEQALGNNHAIDQRSDIYSLSVIYYEWMGLRHYLSHKTNMKDMLWGILQEEPSAMFMLRNEHQPNIPAEYHHFAFKGLQKNPQERYQSALAMMGALQMAMAGKFDVQCPVTLVKRGGNDTLRMIDANPIVASFMIIVLAGLALYGTSMLAMQLYQSLMG